MIDSEIVTRSPGPGVAPGSEAKRMPGSRKAPANPLRSELLSFILKSPGLRALDGLPADIASLCSRSFMSSAISASGFAIG